MRGNVKHSSDLCVVGAHTLVSGAFGISIEAAARVKYDYRSLAERERAHQHNPTKASSREKETTEKFLFMSSGWAIDSKIARAQVSIYIVLAFPLLALDRDLFI